MFTMLWSVAGVVGQSATDAPDTASTASRSEQWPSPATPSATPGSAVVERTETSAIAEPGTTRTADAATTAIAMGNENGFNASASPSRSSWSHEQGGRGRSKKKRRSSDVQ